MDFAKREGKERESESEREPKEQRKERGEEEEKEKCLSQSLSLKATRECFVSSRYVVVVCAFYTSMRVPLSHLFEEEEASSFITTERKKQ